MQLLMLLWDPMLTACARMELYKVLEKLQKRVLYFDTDSCMYIHDPKLWNPSIINSRLGKWTDEEPDCNSIISED